MFQLQKLLLPVAETGSISVNVTDGNNTVISGATVTLTDTTDSTIVKTGTTDSDGACTISDVDYGTYTVSASADGYDDYTGGESLVVDGDETLAIEMTATVTTRDISFTINDGTNAIDGASVVIGETTKTTGSAGGCTFNDIADGEHTVEISATGFTTKTETITVSADNTSFTISLVTEG